MPAPPKEAPVRRNVRVGPQVLPAGGRRGDPPRWPLRDQRPGEDTIWRELWATPQAAAWERLGYRRTVARYCRVLVDAEELNYAAMKAADALEDRLGLTPKAMRILLWTVASDEVAEKRAEQSAPTARGRIKAVG
jgi:hypothetical protein